MTEDVVGAIATGIILVCLAGCCLSGLARGGTRNTEAMRACAEACEPRGMAVWSPVDGCVCSTSETPQ